MDNNQDQRAINALKANVAARSEAVQRAVQVLEKCIAREKLMLQVVEKLRNDQQNGN